MAAPRYIAYLSGTATMVAAIEASSGTANAEQIIATGSTGYLDPSFLPAANITSGNISGVVFGATTLNGFSTWAQAGLAGVSPITITGKIFAGTSATAVPYIYANYGTTAPSYPTGGTFIGMNAPASSSAYFLFYWLNGANRFYVDSGGNTFVNGNVSANGGGAFFGTMSSAGQVRAVIAAQNVALTLTTKNDLVGVTAASAAVTITCESSPSVGQQHTIVKTDTSSNAVNVSGGAYPINGSTTAQALTAQWQRIKIVFFSTALGWVIESN